MKRKNPDESTTVSVKKARNTQTEAKKYINDNYPLISKRHATTIDNMRDIRGVTTQWALNSVVFNGWIAVTDDLDAIRSSPDEWHRTFLTTLISYVESPTRELLNQLLTMEIRLWSNLFIFVSYILYHTAVCLPMIVSSDHPVVEELFIRQLADAAVVMKTKKMKKTVGSSGVYRKWDDRNLINTDLNGASSANLLTPADLLSRVTNDQIAKMLLYMVDTDQRIAVVNIPGVSANATMIKTLIVQNYDSVPVLGICIALDLKIEAQTMITKYQWTPEQMATTLRVMPHPKMELFAAALMKQWSDKPVVLEEIRQLFALCSLSPSYIQEISNLMTYDWIKTTIVGSRSFKQEWSVSNLLAKNSVALYDLYSNLGVDVDMLIKVQDETLHPLQWLMRSSSTDLYPLLSQRYSYNSFALLIDTVRSKVDMEYSVCHLVKQQPLSRDQLLYTLSLCKTPKIRTVLLKALDYKKTFELPALEIKKSQ